MFQETLSAGHEHLDTRRAQNITAAGSDMRHVLWRFEKAASRPARGGRASKPQPTAGLASLERQVAAVAPFGGNPIVSSSRFGCGRSHQVIALNVRVMSTVCRHVGPARWTIGRPRSPVPCSPAYTPGKTLLEA